MKQLDLLTVSIKLDIEVDGQLEYKKPNQNTLNTFTL